MSQDAALPNTQDAGGCARCPRQPWQQYVPALAMGTQRDPLRADEAGAVAVIDLLFGGRYLVFPIEGDAKWMRVERRP